MNKQEFMDEIAARGVIDLSKITKILTDFGPGIWHHESVFDRIKYYHTGQYLVRIDNISTNNPPTHSVLFFNIMTMQWVEALPDDWLLARIAELPFVSLVTITFVTIPSGANVYIDGEYKGIT